MGGLTDALTQMSDQMMTRADPQYGVVNNQLQNQQNMRGVLQQMADQFQQNQQDAPGNGSPQMSPAMLAYAQNMMKMAQANPTPENVGAAQQTQNPYYPQLLQMSMQAQQANIANTQSEAVKNTTVPMDTPMLTTNPQTGEHKIIYPDGSVAGQDPQTGLPFAAHPNSHPVTQATGGNVNPWAMNPVQKAQALKDAEIRTQNIAEADKSVAAAQTARDSTLPGLQELRDLNDSGNVPSVAPEEQGMVSNALNAVGANNGQKANAVARWDNINNSNFTKNLSGIFAGSPGMKMEKPIAEAVSKGSGVPKNVPQQGRADLIQQFMVNGYNNVISAQNNAARLRDPNAPAQPLLPSNFSGRMHYMNEVNATAQKYKQSPQQVMDFIKSKGGVIVDQPPAAGQQ